MNHTDKKNTKSNQFEYEQNWRKGRRENVNWWKIVKFVHSFFRYLSIDSSGNRNTNYRHSFGATICSVRWWLSVNFECVRHNVIAAEWYQFRKIQNRNYVSPGCVRVCVVPVRTPVRERERTCWLNAKLVWHLPIWRDEMQSNEKRHTHTDVCKTWETRIEYLNATIHNPAINKYNVILVCG